MAWPIISLKPSNEGLVPSGSSPCFSTWRTSSIIWPGFEDSKTLVKNLSPCRRMSMSPVNTWKEARFCCVLAASSKITRRLSSVREGFTSKAPASRKSLIILSMLLGSNCFNIRTVSSAAVISLKADRSPVASSNHFIEASLFCINRCAELVSRPSLAVYKRPNLSHKMPLTISMFSWVTGVPSATL